MSGATAPAVPGRRASVPSAAAVALDAADWALSRAASRACRARARSASREPQSRWARPPEAIVIRSSAAVILSSASSLRRAAVLASIDWASARARHQRRCRTKQSGPTCADHVPPHVDAYCQPLASRCSAEISTSHASSSQTHPGGSHTLDSCSYGRSVRASQ